MKAGSLKIRWLYRQVPIVTFCDIIDNKDRLVAEGRANCFYKDHFCKETGRKLSLARAMKSADLPKEERKVIWELYRNTKLGGRW